MHPSAPQIIEYLGRQLGQQLPPADAATHSSKADSGAASTQSPGSAASPAAFSAEEEAGSSLASAGGEGLTAATLLQRLAAESCVRQRDLKPALTAYLASADLGKDRVRPVVWRPLLLSPKPAEWGYRWCKEASGGAPLLR